MSSYTSNSSFGGRSSGSDFSSSPTDSTFHTSFTDGSSHLRTMPSLPEGSEPLDHPLLSSNCRDLEVVNSFGATVMQTKSAWEKQMAHFDKLDVKQAKKNARKAKHHKEEVIPQLPKSKKDKKAEKKMKEMEGELE